MADKKISALTGASTPLAGTEVLPIVQGGATVKVAVSDLTAGRAVNAASVEAISNTTYQLHLATTTGNYSSAGMYLGALGTSDPNYYGYVTYDQSSETLRLGNRSPSSIGGVTFYTGVGTPTERARIDFNGNFLVGSTSTTYNSSGRGLIEISGSSSALLGFKTAGINRGYVFNDGTDMSVFNAMNGFLSFSTNGTERMRLGSSGIVTMSAYGAGAATFSAAGVISSVSDETWKIKDGVPVDTDTMLKKLEPGYWYYNDEKKETFGADRQLGFYAQNVNAAIGPEAAPEPEEGKPWGYYDRSVLAITVMSLQKALTTIESLTARIAALESN